MVFKVIVLLCVIFISVLSDNQKQINGSKMTDNYDVIDKEIGVTRGTKELTKAETHVEEPREDEESVVKESIKDTVSDIVRKVEMLNAEVDRQNLLIEDLRKDLEAKERSTDKMKDKLEELEDNNTGGRTVHQHKKVKEILELIVYMKKEIQELFKAYRKTISVHLQ